MTQQLTTQNATITTAAVQVKTLTISGKQVTLAVFRQLREEPLIAEDCSLSGVPWGVVNYHPDKCGDSSEHLHVVWQRDDELLRSAVYAPYNARHRTGKASLLVEALIAEGRRKFYMSGKDPVDDLHIGARDRQTGASRATFRYDGVRFCGEIRPLAYKVADGDGGLADLKQLLHHDLGPGSAADLLPHLPTEAYRKAWQSLADLPQLFIAV